VNAIKVILHASVHNALEFSGADALRNFFTFTYVHTESKIAAVSSVQRRLVLRRRLSKLSRTSVATTSRHARRRRLRRVAAVSSKRLRRRRAAAT